MHTRVTQVVMPRARRTRARRPRVREGGGREPERLVRSSSFPLRERMRTAARIVLPLLGLGALGLAVHALTSASAFHLKTIRISGQTRVSAEEIEAIIRRAAKAGALHTDLRALRAELRHHPLIKDVEITRVLPDELRVRIVERTPAALVQHKGALVCVDEEGTILGDFHILGSQTLPLLMGWNEEDSEWARTENRRRVALYLELQKALSTPEPSYWDRVDQVNIRDLTNVTVNLTESPMTWIHLGDRDFRQRFELGLHILSAVKKQDAAELRRLGVAPTAELLQEDVTISYVDVSQPSRVVIRLPEPRRAPTLSRAAPVGTLPRSPDRGGTPVVAVDARARKRANSHPTRAR
jgi:hypothetical protein